MKKLKKSRFFALFVSAVLILNQAAFLFIPVNSSHAEEGHTTVTLTEPGDGSTISGQGIVQVQVDTAETVDEVNFHWSITGVGQVKMTHTGNNEYQYNWDTTLLDDGKYYLKAIASVGGQDYHSVEFGVKVDNASQVPSITVSIIEPADGETIYGQGIAKVHIDTAETVDKAQFYWSVTEVGQTDMVSVGNNEYEYNWDTAAIADGKYELKARACINGADYYSQSITVAVANDVSDAADPVSINIEFINALEYISKSTVFSARVDTEVDEIFFDVFGPVGALDTKNKQYTAIPEGINTYYFNWDITDFPDGPYKLKAFVSKGAFSTYRGTKVNIQRDMSVVSGDGAVSISAYLPECGIKEECSSNGICTETIKTYDNKQAIIEAGADFLYHGICKSDDINSDEFAKMCEEEYEPICGEIKICEGDFCRARIQTFSNLCKLRINRGRLLYYGGCKEQIEDVDIVKIEEKSNLLVNDKLGDILVELQELRNIVREQENEIKYLRSFVADLKKITQQMQSSINNFITYGVDDNTKRLGAGERAAVIHSFKSAFNKLPENEEELSDAIKIANGRWPSLRSEEAEERARAKFHNIYKRNPDTENQNDNAAVTVMAYGLRQKAENRNLESEKQGIKTFRHIYNKLPETTEDWNIMQAITYSGATR